jgi:nicotinate phosphoribosyltransferase
VGASSSVLLTDLYQLAMLEAYRREGMEDRAVFELFARRLPAGRGFLLAAGLEQALGFLETLRFEADELEWLASTGEFGHEFLEWLSGLRFTGDVWAMPEGTPLFANEPMLRVEAPLPQAQLVESRLMNILHFQTMIASKAVRCVLAAGGRRLVDFGMRRAHEADAALHAARAAYLAGFDGTATVLAGRRFGIPIFGTMAHSYVQAHASEEAAFEAFATARPDGLVLLVDTYDFEAAIPKVAAVHRRLRDAGGPGVRAVRLDSGDLAAGAKRIRERLDAAGCREVGVFLSGNLDEWKIRDIMAAGAPVAGFGVGTSLDTSSDAPSIDFAYKLQSYAGLPRRKRSAGKATWPGSKQVWRRYRDGCAAGDLVGRASGDGLWPDARPLLVEVMRAGGRSGSPETLENSRRRAAELVAGLPEGVKALEAPESYDVEISAGVEALAQAADAAVEY